MFAKRIPSVTLIFFICVSFLFSASVGVIGSLAYSPEYAHTSDDVYAFMGNSIQSLNDARLKKLSTPSSVACGDGSCVTGIDQETGDVYCASAGSRIFGAGSCTQTPRCVEGDDENWLGSGGSDTVCFYSWQCTHTTEPNEGCSGEKYEDLDSDAALEQARSSAISKCCPDNTDGGGIGPSAALLGGGTSYKGYWCKE